jgi:acyl-CoA thioester hydrolase
MADQGYSQSYRVKWADLDPNGHVRHSAYDDYAVDTRVRWMEQNGFPPRRFAELGFGPVILRQESRFYREVTLEDTITVTIQLKGLSADGSRWKVQHDILKASGEKAAALEIEGSWLDLRTRKAMAPPAELLRLFTQVQQPEELEELRSLVRRR